MIEALVKAIRSEWQVVRATPMAIALVGCLAVLCTWSAMTWGYETRIQALNDQLNAKQGQITTLKEQIQTEERRRAQAIELEQSKGYLERLADRELLLVAHTQLQQLSTEISQSRTRKPVPKSEPIINEVHVGPGPRVELRGRPGPQELPSVFGISMMEIEAVQLRDELTRRILSRGQHPRIRTSGKRTLGDLRADIESLSQQLGQAQ